MAGLLWTDKVRKYLSRTKKSAVSGVGEIQFSLRRPRGINISGTWKPVVVGRVPAARRKSRGPIILGIGLVIFACFLLLLVFNQSTSKGAVSLQKHIRSNYGVMDRG